MEMKVTVKITTQAFVDPVKLVRDCIELGIEAIVDRKGDWGWISTHPGLLNNELTGDQIINSIKFEVEES